MNDEEKMKRYSYTRTRSWADFDVDFQERLSDRSRVSADFARARADYSSYSMASFPFFSDRIIHFAATHHTSSAPYVHLSY